MFKEVVKFLLMMVGVVTLCLLVYFVAAAPTSFTHYEVAITIAFAIVVVVNYLGASSLFYHKKNPKENKEVGKSEGKATNF